MNRCSLEDVSWRLCMVDAHFPRTCQNQIGAKYGNVNAADGRAKNSAC